MQFEFATAERILFGWGSSKKLSLNQFGARLMLVTEAERLPSIGTHLASWS